MSAINVKTPTLKGQTAHDASAVPFQEAPQRPRYVIRNAAFALAPQPPKEWIIEGLAARGDVIVPFGDAGSKKTYSMLSLCVCVSSGKSWLNFKTTRTKVLIIDEESGERRLSRRLGEAIRGELCNETIDLKYVTLANFKLDDPTDAVLVQSLIEATGAGLVLIDALADVMDGDENSKQDTQPVFSALRKIAEDANAAIIVIHHSNKAGGYRGSSAIKGAVDLMIEIKSDEDSRVVNFQTIKERDIERTSWAAEAVWKDDQFYLLPTETQERATAFTSKSEAFVIRYLQERPSAAIDDIMGNADTCTPEAARRAVYTLANRGVVARIDGGGRGSQAVYQLTEGGKKL